LCVVTDTEIDPKITPHLFRERRPVSTEFAAQCVGTDTELDPKNTGAPIGTCITD
jgi:hypothetical protein